MKVDDVKLLLQHNEGSLVSFKKNSNLISTKNPSWKFIEDLNDLTPRENNENINLNERFSNINPLSSFD